MSREVGPYHEVLRRVRAFRQEIATVIADEAMAESDEMIILNQDDQLQLGIDSQGKRIKPAYTRKTKTIKRRKGQPTDRVTLHDEGDWYRGFITERINNKIYFDSTDSKNEKLVTKYGDEIFGLNKKSIAEFVNRTLRQRVVNRFRRAVLG